jgi:hypothetical protein
MAEPNDPAVSDVVLFGTSDMRREMVRGIAMFLQCRLTLFQRAWPKRRFNFHRARREHPKRVLDWPLSTSEENPVIT